MKLQLSFEFNVFKKCLGYVAWDARVQTRHHQSFDPALLLDADWGMTFSDVGHRAWRSVIKAMHQGYTLEADGQCLWVPMTISSRTSTTPSNLI